MAPKRAAQSPKARGRSSKAAKVSATPKAVPKQDSKFSAADALISELSLVLPSSCAEMLSAALPHALETGEEGRHGFQRSLLDMLERSCSEERGKRERHLAELEAKLAAFDGESAEGQAKVAAAQAEEEERRSRKKVAEAAASSAEGAAAAAGAALNGARVAAAAVAANAERVAQEKRDFEGKVEELFVPLRDGAFAKKDWRQRQRTISQLMGLLTKASAPGSLIIALPHALKEAPDARGPFAKVAVEEAESILKEHGGTMGEAVDVARGALKQHEEAVAAAESLEREAVAARDAAQEDCISRDNEWLEAQEDFAAANALVADFPEERRRMEAEVAEAAASLQRLLSAADAFKALASPPAAPEPAPGAGQEVANAEVAGGAGVGEPAEAVVH